jgi:hypothetical protein
MAITIICPNLMCRSVLQVPEATRGQKVRCGRCGKNFRVPDRAPGQKPKPAVQQTDPTKQ